MNTSQSNIAREIDKNRTFAIISHPDAGKTTVTEKLLLFGGAIQIAGTVKARKSKKYSTSDWMEIEKQRGISVTSSVMKFSYRNLNINLLDTPGHKDFSEDTYRVLTAVDSCIMIIDGAKGVEEQTKKLLEICKIKKTPVITFINKFDRECKNPFDLISEVESVLKINCSPIMWPIGMGKEFKGIYNLSTQKTLLFDEKNTKKDATGISDLSDPLLKERLGTTLWTQLAEDTELLLGAGIPFEKKEYLQGNLTPVFFGSAIHNFGLKELLHGFIDLAPKPLPRIAEQRAVSPEEKNFSAFIFKIQANMDLQHRDRIAFARICSGKFKKGMKVFHSRLKKTFKINNTVSFMAQDRLNIETAYPGDIIGIYDSGQFRIGDALTEGEILDFKGIPHFSPEHFFRIKLENPLRLKQLGKGIDQLSEEGATQVFRKTFGNDSILGVVGILQIEVIKFRLKNEYNVDGSFESVPYSLVRWYESKDRKVLNDFENRCIDHIATDSDGKKVFLAGSFWDLDYAKQKTPGIEFFDNSDFITH